MKTSNHPPKGVKKPTPPPTPPKRARALYREGFTPGKGVYPPLDAVLGLFETPDESFKARFEKDNEARPAIFARCAEAILQACGESHEGVAETPKRYAKAMREMLSGYFDNPNNHVKVFPNVHSSSMITVMGLDFNSFCEHHMLPFFGKAYVGYIPNEQGQMVLGVSKLVRILHCFTNRFQVQERIGEQFCEFLEYNLQTHGVICVLKAQHMCMTRRGVKSTGTMITSAIRGAFTEPVVREEFMNLVNLSQKEG